MRRLLNLAGVRTVSNDNPQGQILANTPMGSWLRALVFDPEVGNIVEIGTWKGLGSTILLHNAARQRAERPRIWSLEVNPDHLAVARSNVPDDGIVNLVLGSVVELESLDTADLSLQEQTWLESDSAAISSVPNVLSELPHEISLLLLDGGEFSSYAEFKKLRPRLTKWLVLDDILVRKNRKVHAELSSRKDWRLVAVGSDRNGWAVWMRATFDSTGKPHS